MHGPLIVELEKSHSEEDANNIVRCHTQNSKAKSSNTLEGIDGQEMLQQVTIYEKSSQVILNQPTYNMMRH